MKHKKILILALLISISLMVFGGLSTVAAESVDDSPSLVSADDAATRGLFVSVSVKLKGNGNGTVSAIAKNDFTLGTTTLAVKVELYASKTKPMDYTDMELVSSNYTSDLNIFDSITTTASTGGEAKYWCARVQYNKDNTGWKSDVTTILYYNSNGTVVN